MAIQDAEAEMHDIDGDSPIEYQQSDHEAYYSRRCGWHTGREFGTGERRECHHADPRWDGLQLARRVSPVLDRRRHFGRPDDVRYNEHWESGQEGTTYRRHFRIIHQQEGGRIASRGVDG